MNKINRSYYAVIPASVRYDEKLSANAKLLYAEITALSNEKGYCWASSNYFAELYKVSDRSVRSWIKQLNESQYIRCDITGNNDRKIYLKDLPISDVVVGKKLPTGRKKTSAVVGRKLPHNNIINIITNTSVSIIDIDNFQKAIFVLELKELTDNQNAMIAKLIEKYPSRDYEFQAQKCKDWWFTHPRTGWKKPLLAFSNWLDRSKADDGIVAKKQAERMKIEQDKRDYVGPVDPESKKKVDAIKAQIREKFRMKK
jgi:hypothetical protein